MKVRTDDLLHRVDRTWLGPKILRFPWHATYQAYFIGAGTTIAIAYIGIKIGLPINVVTVVGWIVVSLLTTKKITQSLDPDRPVRAALARFWHELTAPRPVPPKTESAVLVLTVDRWRYGAEPERRRLVRWAMVVRSAVGRAVGGPLMRLGGAGATLGRLIVRGGRRKPVPVTRPANPWITSTPPTTPARPQPPTTAPTPDAPAKTPAKTPPTTVAAPPPQSTSPTRNTDALPEEEVQDRSRSYQRQAS